MLTLLVTMVIGQSALAAGPIETEIHYFGMGARPARAYVEALAAAFRSEPTEKSPPDFEEWALGYVSARVATNDRLAPIEASLNWGAPMVGPEYMKKLGTMSEENLTHLTSALFDKLRSLSRAHPDARFGTIARRAGQWLIESYLPTACGLKLDETSNGVAPGAPGANRL